MGRIFFCVNNNSILVVLMASSGEHRVFFYSASSHYVVISCGRLVHQIRWLIFSVDKKSLKVGRKQLKSWNIFYSSRNRSYIRSNDKLNAPKLHGDASGVYILWKKAFGRYNLKNKMMTQKRRANIVLSYTYFSNPRTCRMWLKVNFKRGLKYLNSRFSFSQHLSRLRA